MRATGLAVPEGVMIEVVENTDTLVHLVLPATGVVELADRDLEAVAGGIVKTVPTVTHAV
jgi:hypothetical protein